MLHDRFNVKTDEEHRSVAVRINDFLAVMECPVPCMRMKELEASRARFAERRLKAIAPKSERRVVFSIKRRIRLAQTSYLMQMHLHDCVECGRLLRP